jgi:hypothetical protein
LGLDSTFIWEWGIGNYAKVDSEAVNFCVDWELGSRFIRFCAQKFYFRRDWELGLRLKFFKCKITLAAIWELVKGLSDWILEINVEQ